MNIHLFLNTSFVLHIAINTIPFPKSHCWLWQNRRYKLNDLQIVMLNLLTSVIIRLMAKVSFKTYVTKDCTAHDCIATADRAVVVFVKEIQ